MSTTLEKATFPDLGREQCIALTTFRKTGQAVTTPVWFAQRLGTIYVETHADAGKLKRLRHTARVTLAPCTYSGKVTGAVSAGNARILMESEECTAASTALAKKYGFMRPLYHFITSSEMLDACFNGGRESRSSTSRSNPFQAEPGAFHEVQSCGEGCVSDPFSRPMRL